MFEAAGRKELTAATNSLIFFGIRAGVALAFIAFGAEKFSSASGSEWVVMFHRIGLGDWFRYFTGVVEISGALLVLIPRTARIGLALLAATMLSATSIVAVVLHSPGDSVFPGLLFAGLLMLVFLHRRD